MEISSCYYQSYNPNFTSSSRTYPNKIFTKHTDGNICTTTWMFRPDVDWDNLPKLLEDNFKNKEHVNIYSVACSDGSEPYTLAISIMEKLSKKKRNKFFPIIATDKDFEIINAAKSRKINLSRTDVAILKEHTDSAHEYFKNEGKILPIKYDECSKQSSISSYEPVNKLKDAVSFNQSDILKQLYRIRDNGNTVVMCRNVTPYLSTHYVDLLAEALKKQLKQGSLLITGKFDGYINFEKWILDEGCGNPCFEKIGENIYRRTDAPFLKKLGVEPQFDTNKFYHTSGY